MKILIICLDNIGDVVMSTIIPRALKNKFSETTITYLVKEYSKDVVQTNPLVNEILIFNPSWLSDPLKKHFTFGQITSLIKNLKICKFDLCLVVNADWKKALLASLSGIPEKIGAKRKKAGFFLTRTYAYQPSETRHMIEDNIDLLRILKIEAGNLLPEVFSRAEDDRTVTEFLKKNGITQDKRIVGIHPFSNHPSRDWQIDKFIALADKLIDRDGLPVLFMMQSLGQDSGKITQLVKKKGLYVMDNMDLGQLIAFIKCCSVFIGNDSGPMHLAAALKVPTVGIFGPSNPKRFSPLGNTNIVVRNELPCNPCGSSPDCKTLECLKSITVEQVYEAVKQLLA
jgi:lipopolysaccharide heptosyltransferase II